MKGSYRIFLAAMMAFALASVAQTGFGPQSPNSNRNEPQIQIQGQTPSGSQPAQNPAMNAPSSTPPVADTTKPADSKPADSKPPTDLSKPSTAATPSTKDQNTPGTLVYPMPAPGAEPQTQLLPGADTPASADPLLQPAPLPKGDPATLVGGTADKVDRIRNRVVIQPFGGGKRMDIRFDDRSHFFRDGRETTILGIKKGDRVYADTMLVDGKVFAKNLRVQTSGIPAEARGQVRLYDASTGRVVLQDNLTSQLVYITVSPTTPVTRQFGSASAADLKPGTLIDVVFAPGRKIGDARQINILAQPGANYMFVGRVTNVNMSSGTLAVENQSDNKNYEIHFDPRKMDQRELLVIGAEVAANTVFDGKTYTAQTMTVTAATNAQQ